MSLTALSAVAGAAGVGAARRAAVGRERAAPLRRECLSVPSCVCIRFRSFAFPRAPLNCHPVASPSCALSVRFLNLPAFCIVSNCCPPTWPRLTSTDFCVLCCRLLLCRARPTTRSRTSRASPARCVQLPWGCAVPLHGIAPAGWCVWLLFCSSLGYASCCVRAACTCAAELEFDSATVTDTAMHRHCLLTLAAVSCAV